MVINRGTERIFLRFKKNLEEHVPWDGLVGNLQSWVNDLVKVLTLDNVKINLG